MEEERSNTERTDAQEAQIFPIPPERDEELQETHLRGLLRRRERKDLPKEASSGK